LTAGSTYSLQVCDVARTMGKPDCSVGLRRALSADFYKAPFHGASLVMTSLFPLRPLRRRDTSLAPVCLNSLLYKSETDLEQISKSWAARTTAEQWRQLAGEAQIEMQKYLWNGQRGLS